MKKIEHKYGKPKKVKNSKMFQCRECHSFIIKKNDFLSSNDTCLECKVKIAKGEHILHSPDCDLCLSHEDRDED